MKTPIIDKKMYRSPMKNPTYSELILSNMSEQTIEQNIACDAILATKLKHDKRAMKEVGFRLANLFNHLNFGEKLIAETLYPLNCWLTETDIKKNQDTDYIPNTN